MSIYGIERQIEQLENQLDAAIAADDYEEQRVISAEIRELERELADAQRWQDEGQNRGWL